MASEPGATAEAAEVALKAEVTPEDDDTGRTTAMDAAATIVPDSSSSRRGSNRCRERRDEKPCRVKIEQTNQRDRFLSSRHTSESSNTEAAGDAEAAFSIDYHPGGGTQHGEQVGVQGGAATQTISTAVPPTRIAASGSSMAVSDPYQSVPSERYHDNQVSYLEDQGSFQQDSNLPDQQHNQFAGGSIGMVSALPSSPTSAAAPAEGSEHTPAPAQPFSWNDILRVQNMIERCLQQYFSKNEILFMLKDQAHVDPEFTNVVWQKLQEQNPSFFRAYNIQLQLKEQILAFNYLVMQQKEMMQSGSRVPSSLPSLLQPEAQQFPRMSGAYFGSTPSTHTGASGASSGQAHQSTPFAGMGSESSNQLMSPPSPLPLPSPIKTDLDTHAFFT